MLKILSRQVAPLTTCKAANAQQSGTVIIGDGGGGGLCSSTVALVATCFDAAQHETTAGSSKEVVSNCTSTYRQTSN